MENQNIQWENWESQPQENNEQPQVNWSEQPQDQSRVVNNNWGEQPQQQENIPTWEEQPQKNIWGEHEEQPHSSPEPSQPTWGEQPPQNGNLQSTWEDKSNIEETQTSSTNNISLPKIELDTIHISPVKNYSILGKINRISIDTELYQINSNLERVLNDLDNSNLIPLDTDGRFEFSPQKDTDLGNVIRSIVQIANKQGLKITNCFVYKNKPNESSLNVFKGKPKKHFIYFIKGDFNSGDVVLDLSSIGGPSIKVLDSTPNMLNLTPGWVPFSISRNNSDEEFIALVGTLD